MEQPFLPEALQGFHQEDAGVIMHIVRQFGWDLNDFLNHSPGLRECLEEYHGDFGDREYPKIQRSNIIDGAMDLYRERLSAIQET